MVLIASLAGFAAGLGSGLIIQYRRQVVDGGRVVWRPVFEFTAKRVDMLLAIGVVAAMVMTVMMGAYNNQRQAECNAVLREAVEARVYSSETSRESTRDLLSELAAEPRPGAVERAAAIDRYERTQALIDDYLEDHPIPPPVRGCGI